MKILQVSPYSPVPPIFGGALRVFHLLRGLARRHDVTFLTFGTENDLEQLRLCFGGMVRDIRVVRPNPLARKHPWLGMLRALFTNESFYSQYTSGTNIQGVIDSLFREQHFDATVIEFPHMARFRYGKSTVSVLDEHNVEYSNFVRMYRGVRSPARKLLYFREHRKTYREEISVCNRVDSIFATSENDRLILDREVPHKPKYVIPNGVDIDYFTPSLVEPEPYSMVFTGTMDYIPNQDAMFFFLDHVFPLIKGVLPRAKIYIVGKNPPRALERRASRDVIVTGFVEDVRPFTRKAAVYVVPLRMGSGTRLKILEGLAMKKAIVTTSIGCEGIDVRDGRDVIIADDPAAFASSTVDLLLNRGKAATLGSNGYELVKAKYDWDVISASMDEILTTLVREKTKRRTQVVRSSPGASVSREHEGSEGSRADSQPPIKVLMYHRVTDDALRLNAYSWNVSRSQFRKQLEMLARWGFTFMNLEDYHLFQKGEKQLPKKPIILTFDDGYDGVYDYAFPIMREFGATATAFVLGDRTIRTNYWDEQAGFEGATLMEDDRLLELRDSGFEIASHSMAHPDLTLLEMNKARDEIMQSKYSLEDLIGSPVLSFAYPFGSSSPEVENLVREAGYIFGCGVYSGPPRFAQNLYNIRRIPVTRGTNPFEFALKVLTPYEYYQWLRWETGQRLLGVRVRVPNERPPDGGDRNAARMDPEE